MQYNSNTHNMQQQQEYLNGQQQVLQSLTNNINININNYSSQQPQNNVGNTQQQHQQILKQNKVMQPQSLNQQRKIIEYQQQQQQQHIRQPSKNKEQMGNNVGGGAHTLQKFKENQGEIQDQLSQLMLKYASQPQSQQVKPDGQTNKTRDLPNSQMSKHVKNKSHRTQKQLQQQQHEKQTDLQLRMSCLGIPQDTEAEDFENQYANDYLYEENDIPLPIAYNQAQQKQQHKYNQQQAQSFASQKIQQLSKSPTPTILFNPSNIHNMGISTPTSLQDVKASQQNPMLILSQYNMQQNARNQQSNLNGIGQGFKSHQVPNNHHDNQNLLREKKKSISTATSNSTNGTFTNTTATTMTMNNLHKRLSNHHEHHINNGAAKAHTQAHTANTSKEPHKKSQSLYNKKIVDIISGLQQSLGVIASNVQHSFNANNHLSMNSGSNNLNEDTLSKNSQQQQKALLESALLAQRIAQMTQGIRKDSTSGGGVGVQHHIKKNSDIEQLSKHLSTGNNGASSKRKSMKITSNLSGRGSLNVVQKHKQGFKTLEDTQFEKKRLTNNSNRMSIDFQQPIRGNSSKTVHQRNRSDVQNPRKQIVSSLNPATQQMVQGYHTKQNTLLTCSNSSIEANPINSQNNVQFVSEDMYINHNSLNQIPSSVKSLNRINQVVAKQGAIQFFQANNNKIQKKLDTAQTIDNTLQQSDQLAVNHKNTAVLTNPHSSGQSSMITPNTIDYPRQSLGQAKSITRQNQVGSQERQSLDAGLKKTGKINKHANLMINPNEQMNQQQYHAQLKSAASSPTLHQFTQQQQQHQYNNANQTTINQGATRKKTHQSSQSNTIFDFKQQNQNHMTTTAQLQGNTEKAKAINGNGITQIQKKKNLIVAQKKDSQTTKSEQQQSSIAQHKRSTSDGSSLTKMFHFKQQMLINKIFNHQQQNNTLQSTSNTYGAVLNTNNQNIPKKQQQQQQRQSLGKNQQPTSSTDNNNQQQYNALKKSKVKVVSSLSSKRLSNEENLENFVSNNHNVNHYQSPRAGNNANGIGGGVMSQSQLKNQLQMNSQGQMQQQQQDVKLSQDMKVFLQKFKDKNSNNVVESQTEAYQQQHQQQQQKQMLIQAITSQQQFAQGNGILKPDENSYLTQKAQQINSNYKYGSNLASEKKSIENSNYQVDQSNKRQSQQVQKAHQIIQSHKRAKSDVHKQQAAISQQNQQLKAQQVIGQSQASKQKMFFLNLNQQQQQQSTHHRQQSLLNNYMTTGDYDVRASTNTNIHGNNSNHGSANTNHPQYNENNYQLVYGVQPTNLIYSARASPTNNKSNKYNFDESKGGQIGSQVTTNTKPFLPTARSENSAKIVKNAPMSNQTTQKKNHYSNNGSGNTNIQPFNNRLIESVNTKLVYNDHQLEQYVQSIKQGNNNNGTASIMQSQQFTKMASILYGGGGDNGNQKIHQQSNKIGGNTIYSTCSDNNNNNNNNNDSLVYQMMKDEQIQQMNVNNNHFNNSNQRVIGSEKSLRLMNIQSNNHSPKLKVQPTPKLNQPGGQQPISNFFNENLIQQQYNNNNLQAQTNFIMAPAQQNNMQVQHQQQQIVDQQTQQAYSQQQQSKTIKGNSEFEGGAFLTFESNLTTHTMNNMTPRSRDKCRLIKQIKLSFNKLKEPIKTTGEFYRIGKMLGKGAFGRVNLAIHKLSNQLVAVKSINKQFLSEDESSKKKMMQEVLILQKTRCDNLVRLYDSFETNKHIVFVMELCAGGDLLNYVRKRRKLKEPVAKYVFKQVVAGLHYCHQKGIVHRDMKLDNLLLDEQGIVKICDFGVSKLLTSPSEIMTEQCGTPAYIAPEILKDKGYRGFGVDIWSLGVCLYAMLFGTVPFKANNMSELHQLIMKAKYSMKEETKPGELPLSEEVKGLLKLLLEPNPDKRITMENILKHKWLEEDETDDQSKIEIFTEQELETIRKDFTYQDMSRYKRNMQLKLKIQQQNQQLEKDALNNNNIPGVGGVVTTEENLFTEHCLDSTQNVLMRNCTTKSIVLAPFNSTRTHIAREDLPQDEQDMDDNDQSHYIPPLPIDPQMMVDKRIIKYAPRVKDINRQYEMNNNCELDNGVYNKFVKQSTDDMKDGSQNNSNNGDDHSKSDNSLVTSMNGEGGDMHGGNQYAAPLVSQNSDEEVEAELIKKNQIQAHSELQQMQTFLQKQKSEFAAQVPDEPILIDYEVVERVEQYGYPRMFIIDSIEKYEMNDAATNYYLLDKEKQQIDDYQNAHFM